MSAYAETQQCRMTAIIKHFGDNADAHRPCGKCDVCNPKAATAQSYHQADAEEHRQLSAVLRALQSQSRSTGKLHTELADGALRGTPAAKDRKSFDALLDALVRAALLNIVTDTFTNSAGDNITYRKASLTHEGREAAAGDSLQSYEILVRDTAPAAASTRSRKRAGSRASRTNPRALGTNTRALRHSTEDVPADLSANQKNLEANLRAWRKSEAAKTGKPAFIVLGDAVIRSIAIANPQSIPELLTVAGIGPNKADHFGANIVAICRNASSHEPVPPAPGNAPSSRPKQTVTNSSSRPERSEVERPPHLFRDAIASSETSSETFHRTRPEASDPTAALTPEQQLLDAQLRAWRKAESQRIGLPQFFVLGASALRSIVMIRPKTIVQLQTISGIGSDKADRFGASILEICRMESATHEGNHAS
jgi:ATP-dependent DNA helicase RecQ